MKPSLFGCNQENGNKEDCSKLILSVFSQCVFVLEVFVNKKFQLDQKLLGSLPGFYQEFLVPVSRETAMWAYLPMQLLILVAHTLSSLTIELWWTLLNMVKLHTNNGFFHLDVSMYPPSNIIYHSPDHYKRYIEIDGRKELQLENVNCEWGPTLPSPPVTSGTKHQAMPSINISPSHQKCKVH